MNRRSYFAVVLSSIVALVLPKNAKADQKFSKTFTFDEWEECQKLLGKIEPEVHRGNLKCYTMEIKNNNITVKWESNKKG